MGFNYYEQYIFLSNEQTQQHVGYTPTDDICHGLPTSSGMTMGFPMGLHHYLTMALRWITRKT